MSQETISARLRQASKYLDAVTALVILLGVPLFGFWSMYSGKGTFFVGYDNVNQFFPWYQASAKALHDGYLLLWDANVYSGHSFVGEFQTGVFYPINLLFLLTFGNSTGIPIHVLEALVVLHFFIASAGGFLLGRQLGLSFSAAAICATLLAYTGAIAARASGQTCIFFGDALIPFALFFAFKALAERRLTYGVLCGCVIGFAALAGHLQPPSIAGLMCIGAYAFQLRSRPTRRFALTVSAITIAATAVVGMPQLLFGFQYLSHAYRWVGAPNPIIGTQKIPFSTYVESAFTPDQFLNIFDPARHSVTDGNVLFIGTLPIIISIFALGDTRSRSHIAAAMRRYPSIGFLAIFAFVMLLGTKTPLAFLVYQIPFASSGVRELGRYAILVQLFLVFLAAVALEALGTSSFSIKDFFRAPGLIVALLLALGYCFLISHTAGDNIVLSYLPIAIVLAIIFTPKGIRTPFLASLIAVEAAFLLPTEYYQVANAATYPSIAFAPTKLYEPVEQCYPDCRLLVLDEVVPPNIGDVYRLQTVYGHGATMYKPYFDLLNEDWDPHGFVYDVLNVRYIISNKRLDGFQFISGDAHRNLYLYERSSELPRVFSLAALSAKGRAANDVKFSTLSYSDQRSLYRIEVPHDETVVFSEQFYPGWSISIDGRSAPMYATSVHGSAPLLRSVKLDAGTHLVAFRYPF